MDPQRCPLPLQGSECPLAQHPISQPHRTPARLLRSAVTFEGVAMETQVDSPLPEKLHRGVVELPQLVET